MMIMSSIPNGRNRRGIYDDNLVRSPFRARAGKPFELTWKDKIYLRRIRNGETQAHIAHVMKIHRGNLSTVLNAAARRFDVETIKELLALDEVQRQLDAED